MDEAVLGMVFFSPYNTRNIHTAYNFRWGFRTNLGTWVTWFGEKNNKFPFASFLEEGSETPDQRTKIRKMEGGPRLMCVFLQRRGFPKKLTLKIGKNAGRGELSQVYITYECWYVEVVTEWS